MALKSPEHRQLTIDAAKALGFSPDAAAILAQAVQAPDWLDWSKAEAHAQTPNDAQGHPLLTPEAAEAASVRYLQTEATKLRADLNAGKVSQALYDLGYALHTIQDFAAHAGMTNAEHSFLSFNSNAPNGSDPDTRPISITRARAATGQFFSAARMALGACDWITLRSFQSIPGDLTQTVQMGVDKHVTGLFDLYQYRRLSWWLLNQYNLPADSVRWVPLEDTASTLLKAYVTSLPDKSGNKLRQFVGTWYAPAVQGLIFDITGRSAGPYSAHREGSQYTWSLSGSGAILTGILPYVPGERASSTISTTIPPPAIWAQVSNRVKDYLTLSLYEDADNCAVCLLQQTDLLKWEMDSAPIAHPTGKYEIIPKDPSLDDRAVLIHKGESGRGIPPNACPVPAPTTSKVPSGGDTTALEGFNNVDLLWTHVGYSALDGSEVERTTRTILSQALRGNNSFLRVGTAATGGRNCDFRNIGGGSYSCSVVFSDQYGRYETQATFEISGRTLTGEATMKFFDHRYPWIYRLDQIKFTGRKE